MSPPPGGRGWMRRRNWTPGMSHCFAWSHSWSAATCCLSPVAFREGERRYILWTFKKLCRDATTLYRDFVNVCPSDIPFTRQSTISHLQGNPDHSEIILQNTLQMQNSLNESCVDIYRTFNMTGAWDIIWKLKTKLKKEERERTVKL